ncbi:hypothetical protein [Bogoriella caseilytica]|uniref:Copper(I)-binding protein n=1 Tax=Bogoriella caseilytica TaxID=56055 RepID=A0A3N2BDA1_9MICO|nr:hypothetical protein [Bogoriella caseilytica]ROR73229.1 hypothetical protein EDD31_1602 [Bogoriella caseilytica]
MTPRRSQLAAVALTASAALALGGCSFTNPVMTLQPYSGGDGVRAELREGAVIVENLMLLTEAEGEAGFVLGSLVNRTSSDVEITLDLDGLVESFEVPAAGTVNLMEENLTIAEITVAPGGKLTGTLSTPEDGSIQVQAPVLDGTVPPYDEYLDAVTTGETWVPRSQN